MKTGLEKLADLMDWSVNKLNDLKFDYELIQHSSNEFEFVMSSPNLTVYFNDIECDLNFESSLDYHSGPSGDRDYFQDGSIDPEVHVSEFVNFDAFDCDGNETEYNPTVHELEIIREKFLEKVQYAFECGKLEF